MSWYDDNENAPKPEPQKCESCGAEKKCLGCDDTRPTANELDAGWLLRSPLDRAETVTRVEKVGEYGGTILVWTDKTGDTYSWRYWRTEKVTAVQPLQTFHGTPEIRIVESSWRDGSIYAVATLSTKVNRTPASGNILAQASYERGTGWTVQHRPNGGDDVATITCDSKAKARSAVKAAAREHARALKVKVTTEATR